VPTIKQRLRLDAERELVSTMDRAERLALIEKLRAESDATAIEIEKSRQQRYLNGDFDPLPTMQPVITKSNDDNGFDVQQCIADQEFQLQRKSMVYKTQQPQASEFVTWTAFEDALEAVADETFGLLASDFKKVRSEIATLRNTVAKLKSELAKVRALAKGEITLIEGKRRNVG
jgi:hypothetical protein